MKSMFHVGDIVDILSLDELRKMGHTSTYGIAPSQWRKYVENNPYEIIAVSETSVRLRNGFFTWPLYGIIPHREEPSMLCDVCDLL